MLLVFVILLTFAYGVLKTSAGPTLVSAIANGGKPQAPGFDLPLIWPRGALPDKIPSAVQDGKLDLGRLRGQRVVLNFWASWCLPCRREAPLLAVAANQHPDVVFLGVDVQDFTADADSFLTRFHVRYASVKDVDNTAYEAYGLTGVPETYYLDRAGRIVAHDPGPLTQQTLDAGLAKTR